MFKVIHKSSQQAVAKWLLGVLALLIFVKALAELVGVFSLP